MTAASHTCADGMQLEHTNFLFASYVTRENGTVLEFYVNKLTTTTTELLVGQIPMKAGVTKTSTSVFENDKAISAC